jgi:TM2 domain-containing membrane protein YozV
MDSNGLGALFCLVVPALIVVALVFLTRRTKEEEARTKLEVQQLVNTLPADRQAAFFTQYNAQSKSPTTAVVLALLLGFFGIHKFYLGQTGLGIVYLLFCWTFIPGFIAFIEAFTISQAVHQMNRTIAQETAMMLGGGHRPVTSMLDNPAGVS